MKKYPYPKTLFVYRSADIASADINEDDLLCYETIEDVADLGEDRLVGIYELNGTGLVKARVELETHLIVKIKK